jgi:hypothetical protein
MCPCVGLYSGLLPSAMRDVPYAALQVLFYTRIKAAAMSEYHTPLSCV